MTDPGYTAIAILADRSGSMNSVRKDAEGAIAAFIAEQAQVPGRCTVRLSDFDSQYQTVYLSTPADQVPYYSLIPRGNTALLDGIGRLTTEFGEELAALDENKRPANVIVVVQTDGHENSSREWSREQVFQLLKDQQEKYGWVFVFLGASQDAVAKATQMGFRMDSSMAYSGTGVGTQQVIASASNYVTRTRYAGKAATFTEEERKAAQKS